MVNACDAGREGELIFRTVYCLRAAPSPYAGCGSPAWRIPPSGRALPTCAPARTMTGCTRPPSAGPRPTGWWGSTPPGLFSVLYHRTLNIGRVMSPTLALIVQREGRDRRLPSRCRFIRWRWNCPAFPLPALGWTIKALPSNCGKPARAAWPRSNRWSARTKPRSRPPSTT